MEKNKDSRLYKLKHQLQENISLLREKFYRNLIFGTYKKEEELIEKLTYLDIPLSPIENYLVAIIQVDISNSSWNENEEERQLLNFSVFNIVEEVISNYSAGVCFPTVENNFVIIFNQKIIFSNKYNDICEEIISYLDKYLKISLNIGIGHPVSKLLQVNNSYIEASTSLMYRFFMGKNSIISIKDINAISDIEESKENFMYSYLYELENKLVVFLKLGDKEGISEVIHEIFENYCMRLAMGVEYVQSLCVELLSIASRQIYDLNENIDTIVDKRSNIIMNIYRAENIFELKEYILSVLNLIASHFSNKYTQKKGQIIKKIKDIIQNTYMESISIASLSEEIYLTPNYLSLTFKQETGETITEYLTHVRMEKAKELLKTTDMKVLAIAEAMGFDSPYYFSTVFKKYAGIYPQKYRACVKPITID